MEQHIFNEPLQQKPGFEQKFWPVCLSLLVLGGMLLGDAIVFLRFDDPRFLWNAWTYVVVIPIILAFLTGVFYRIRDRYAYRGTQFSLILSLIVHFILIVASSNVYWSQQQRMSQANLEDLQQAQEDSLPDYQQWQIDPVNTPIPDLMKPIAAEIPETVLEQVRKTEDDPLQPEEQLHRQADPLVERKFIEPHEIQRRRVAESVPRRSQEQSRLSRQMNRSRPQAVESVSLPETFDTRQSALPEHQPAEASAGRLPTQAELVPRNSSADLSPGSRTPTARLVRRSNTQETQLSSESVSSLKRQASRVEHRGVQADMVKASEPRQATQLKPRETELARRSDNSSSVQPEFSDEKISVAMSTQRSTAASVSWARQASVPTVQPNLPSSGSPRRSARVSQSVMSPVAVLSPALVESDNQGEQREAQPTRTALTRSTGGIAGQGHSSNMDQQLPAPESSVRIASAAANRPAATRRQEQGPAISPREHAAIARSRAGEKTPAAAVIAQQLEHATMRGARRTVESEVTSSAAVARSAAAAVELGTDADKGTQTLDQGAMQIVSNLGESRASGGGQPVLRFDSQSVRVSRASSGVARIAIAVEVQPQSPQDPSGDSGGQPTAEPENALAVFVTRNRSERELLPAFGRLPEIEVVGSTRIIDSQLVRRAETSTSVQGQKETKEVGLASRKSQLPKKITSLAGIKTSVIVEANQTQGTVQNEIPAPRVLRVRRIDGAIPQRDETSSSNFSESGDTGEGDPAIRLAMAIERRREQDSKQGPTLKSAASEKGQFQKTTNIETPAGVNALVEIDETVETAGRSQSPTRKSIAKQETIELGRSPATEVPVEIVAQPGPGGLASELALNVGRMSRRAQLQSQEIHEQKARFLRKNTGGPPAVQVTVAIATNAFAGRKRRSVIQAENGIGQPPPKTEEAIEAGLRFLAVCQSPDGSWSLSRLGTDLVNRREKKPSMQSDTAATGLALLAFLGAGYQHLDDKYKGVVRAGVDYLVQHQKESGELFIEQDQPSSLSVRLYSHGIASIALCEAYGMTQDPKLQQPAQKTIDFIVQSQHPQRGGWRYTPGQGSDTSVTGWLMMALKSGQLASLDVPADVFQKIEHWLDLAQVSPTQRHLYRYNPYAPDTATQRHGRLPNKTMTSVGLLMRLYLGWRRDNSELLQGGEYLLEKLPELGTTSRPQRDAYYWYYATQVMFHLGEKYWSRWNARLHPLLVESQLKEGVLAGSWDPYYPVPDRWGPQAGRLYVTTLNLLSLEVYYRHLPIYEDTAK